jgi:hypothetical protein
MGIKVQEKRIHYTEKIDTDHKEFSFYYYNGIGRFLVAGVVSLVITFATILIPPIPFVPLYLLIPTWVIVLAPNWVWQFDSRESTFQKIIEIFGIPLATRDFSRDLFIHMKFDLKIVLKSLKKVAGAQGPLIQKYENFDVLAQDLKDWLKKADFGTANIKFALYFKGKQADTKVIIPLPEVEVYLPRTDSLWASPTPLNEVFTALFPPRTRAFLQTFSQFYPLTDTFFSGKRSKVKNMMSMQLRKGTRSSSSASSGWWELVELIAEIGGLFQR